MTKTEIVMVKAKTHDSWPKKYQAIPERIAKTITIGTKTPDTLSANWAIGAFEP